MTNVYQRLATHLDNLPASFPATDSGVELRILKQLFTPDEAEAALALTLFPESAEGIAKRLSKDQPVIEKLLFRMSKKGLIRRSERAPLNTWPPSLSPASGNSMSTASMKN